MLLRPTLFHLPFPSSHIKLLRPTPGPENDSTPFLITYSKSTYLILTEFIEKNSDIKLFLLNPQRNVYRWCIYFVS